jgi:hypothetical protein
MTHHLQDLKRFMEFVSQPDPLAYSHTSEIPDDIEIEITVASDHDTLLESLELLKFKLMNHRQMVGSSDYALGYEEACMKVVEMIDGILYNHGSF